MVFNWVTLLSCYLLNAEIPLFSLKMKTFGFVENAMIYIFLLIAVILLMTLQFLAIPIIIFVYILLSVITNFKK